MVIARSVAGTPKARVDIGSLAVVILLVAIAAALVAGNHVYRSAEVVIAGRILDLISSYGTYVAPERQTVYFGLGSSTPFGLRMSPECTSAFLLVPLLVMTAVMIALRPRISRSVLIALAVAGLVLVTVNQLRVLTLVGLINWLGTDRGYHLGHTVFGSLVSVFGGAAALVVFVLLATRPAGDRTGAARGRLR